MFYKYSTAPLFLSVVYAVAVLKDWPFRYGTAFRCLFTDSGREALLLLLHGVHQYSS